MSLGLCNANHSGSISPQEIEANFKDLHPLLSLAQAKAEASRCLYCYEAPCMIACPTSIDVPTFIKQIATDNLLGSAKTILSENIMGGTCARACPTEILCEQACVLNQSLEQPVKIGQLQRYAVDHLLERQETHPFKRQALTGKKVAILGAGPAGLSCAHRLAMLGHQVTLHEARAKAGGLNEYGLAAYKMADDFAQKEVDFLLSIGGIELKTNCRLNREVSLTELRSDYDAVFIAIGLTKVNQLGIEGENSPQVADAIEFIEAIRQTEDKSQVAVGNDVVVIGAGNTAIDAAIQAKRLGAQNVALVYRRDEKSMSATDWEVDLARLNQVKLIFNAAPVSYDSDKQQITFVKTHQHNGHLELTDETFDLPADQLLKAIGQGLASADLAEKADSQKKVDNQNAAGGFSLAHKKIAVSQDYMTSIEGVFAGGDCVDGDDLTVEAVQDGKLAAQAIDRFLSRQE